MPGTFVKNFPRLFAERLIEQLRDRLDLGPDECYLVIKVMPVEGMVVGTTIQIEAGGAAQPHGAGDGGQDGGEILDRQQNFNVGIFYVVNIDPHQMTEEALTEAGDGIIDKAEQIRGMICGANLGNIDAELAGQLTEEGVRYRGENDVMVIDEDKATFLKQFTFSYCYAVPFADEDLSIGNTA